MPAKSFSKHTKQKDTSLQPPPPLRLCQIKNNPKLFRIFLFLDWPNFLGDFIQKPAPVFKCFYIKNRNFFKSYPCF